MDYRFVELACKIPPAMKIRNGYTKNIMRELFHSRMPEAVTWRTNKMGFNAPVDLWMKQFSQSYLADLVNSAVTAPYFRMDKLSSLVSTRPYAPSLFDFIQYEQFARQFGVS